MSKPASAPPWYQPWRRTESRVQDDPADLGTCYGLELTLAAEPAPTRTAKSPTLRTGWMQRLALRRRATLAPARDDGRTGDA